VERTATVGVFDAFGGGGRAGRGTTGSEVRVAEAGFGVVGGTPVAVAEGAAVVGGGSVPGGSVGDGVPVDGRAVDDGGADGGADARGVDEAEGADPDAGAAVAVGGPGVGDGRVPSPATAGGSSPGPEPTWAVPSRWAAPSASRPTPGRKALGHNRHVAASAVAAPATTADTTRREPTVIWPPSSLRSGSTGRTAHKCVVRS